MFISIVVLSCVGWTNFADYNPHQVRANLMFVRTHPSECKAEPPQILDRGVTYEQCMARAELAYMPGWMQKPENKHRVWLGALCERHNPSDEIMGETPP